MSKKETSEDDEQMKINLACQGEDPVGRAKVTVPTAKTFQDLPMELQERILLEAIASEVKHRKPLGGAWQESVDYWLVQRLRNVCPQWDYTLTTEAFRKRLHGMLNSFPPAQVEFCFNILASRRFSECVTVTSLNNEVFVLCHQPEQHARIKIYEHNNLKKRKRTIQLPGVTMPWNLVACSKFNCLYVLHQVSTSIEIWKVLEEKDEFQISPWILCSNNLITRMSTSADGSLIVFQGPAPSTIKVYNAVGSLQHQVELVNRIYYLHDVLAKSNGNFLLVKKTSLTEVDREGNTLYENNKPLGEYIYCALDLYDRIVTLNDGGYVKLLDSEFNSLNVEFEDEMNYLASGVRGHKHFYRVHYNRQRNEFIAFECAAFHSDGAKQCLTIFNFTERSIPNDAPKKRSLTEEERFLAMFKKLQEKH